MTVSVLFVCRKLNMQYTGDNFNGFYYLKGLHSEKRNCMTKASREFSKISVSSLNDAQKLNTTATLLCIENLVKLKTWLTVKKKTRRTAKIRHKETKQNKTKSNKEQYRQSRVLYFNRKWVISSYRYWIACVKDTVPIELSGEVWVCFFSVSHPHYSVNTQYKLRRKGGIVTQE